MPASTQYRVDGQAKGNHMKRVGLLLLLSLCVPVVASAAPFTWEFQGAISSVNANAIVPPAGNPFTLNQPFTLVLTQESTAPDLAPGSPTCGVYAPVSAALFTAGATSASGTSGAYSIHTSSYTSPAPLNCVVIPSGANIGLIQLGLSGNYTIVMHFTGTYATDALVTDLSNFNPLSFDILYGLPDNLFANGRITSRRVVSAVPEPATASLIGLSLLGAAVRRRRR